MRMGWLAGLGGVVAAAALGWAGYSFWWQSGGDGAFGAVDGYVFVADGSAPQLALINAADDSFAGTLNLPFIADQVLVSRAISRVILSNREQNLISILDLPTRAMEANFRLPLRPDVMVLSPDGLRLAVADTEAGKIAFINFIDGTLGTVIEGLNRPSKLTFDADGVVLFVVDDATAELKMLHARRGEMLESISLRESGVVPGDAEMSALTRTPDGRSGIITDARRDRAYVINFREWQVQSVIPLGKQPGRAYGTADGQFMLVANAGSQTLSIIATDRFAVVATLPGVADVTSIATGFFETLAYVISRSDQKAVVIDMETLTVAGEVALQGIPGEAIADADGKKIYVPLGGVGELALIDIYGKKIGHTIAGMPAAPGAPTMAATNNYCH